MQSRLPQQVVKPWRAIFAATATIGAVGMALGLGTQLISILMAARGFSSSIIGYSGTVGGIATIIAAVFTARIAKSLGVARSILTMMAIGCASFLGFYYFESIIIWFLLRFSLHFAITVMFILSEFWVNNSAPPAKRGTILAIYAITLGLGFTIGPTLLAHVGSQGFAPFGAACFLIAIAAIPIIIAWNLSPQFKDSDHIAFMRYIFAVPTSTMAVLVYGAIQMGALTLITPFSLNLGYNEAEASKFMSVLALGNVLLLIPIGMISDFVTDKRYPLMGCAIIGLVGTLTIPLIAEVKWQLTLDLFILGGVSAGLYTIGLAQLGARLKGFELAAANSAFIFCYGIGMLVGPTAIGKAMDIFPPFGFSNTMATFFGLYIILVITRVVLKLIRS
ncbi:MFS transporter [uncultured Bartonella sp.]|uniref:MFS transporter n=1 Tax=uncultured Bartonella sp. TaxID=104108 RepID=UPI0025DC6498|nr:MFS transporter [uncultured Bartonella sp.]